VSSTTSSISSTGVPDILQCEGPSADPAHGPSHAAHGQLRAATRLQWSGHCTIRIIVFRVGPLGGSRQQVLDMFAPLGATGEGIEQYAMVALDIPSGAQIAAIKRLLRQGQRDGWWEHEEGCIGPAWQAAEPD
jgi:Domain of unknown function (DUF4265)